MLQRFSQRMRDMRTLSALCRSAERHALAEGQSRPGAEHFLLAALELTDGTAGRAFERVQADPDRFRAAIARQYAQALRQVGVDVSGLDTGEDSAVSAAGIYRAAPSGQSVVQGLAELRARDRDAPPLGAHVIEVIAGMERGVAVRALQAMGVEPASLAAAARAEVAVAASA
jgi:hypothetical protein